jgi:hypothetical protein
VVLNFTFFWYTVFTWMQDEVYSLHLAVKYLRSSEICVWSAKLVALNRATGSQTKACIAKSSCDICTVLTYYIAQSSNFVPMFGDNISIPSSRTKKSKRENRAWLKLTDVVFLFVTLCIVKFIKERSTSFQKLAVFLFSGIEAPKVMDPLDWVIATQWAPYKQYLVKVCTWERI